MEIIKKVGEWQFSFMLLKNKFLKVLWYLKKVHIYDQLIRYKYVIHVEERTTHKNEES